MKWWKRIGKGALNLVFPPFCVVCGELFEKKPFCGACWELCSLIDPAGRCPHCFEESEGLCRRCIKKPWIVFTQAFVFESTRPAFHLALHREDLMASFLMCQWGRLDWPVPDIIVLMPRMKKIAHSFAEQMQLPCASVLDIEAIEEDRTILLLDRGGFLEERVEAVQSLCTTFPKKGYLLSLFTHDTYYF